MASRCQKMNVRLDHICGYNILMFFQHIECSEIWPFETYSNPLFFFCDDIKSSTSAVDKFGYCLAISKIFSECVFSDQLPDGPPVKVLVIKSIGLNQSKGHRGTFHICLLQVP